MCLYIKRVPPSKKHAGNLFPYLLPTSASDVLNVARHSRSPYWPYSTPEAPSQVMRLLNDSNSSHNAKDRILSSLIPFGIKSIAPFRAQKIPLVVVRLLIPYQGCIGAEYTVAPRPLTEWTYSAPNPPTIFTNSSTSKIIDFIFAIPDRITFPEFARIGPLKTLSRRTRIFWTSLLFALNLKSFFDLFPLP